MTGGVAAGDEKPDRSSTQHLLRWLLLDDAQEPRPGVLLLDDRSSSGAGAAHQHWPGRTMRAGGRLLLVDPGVQSVEVRKATS
jgi:hypothetical protein